jgi:hypothetical protein
MEWDTSWAGFTGEYLVGTISLLENLESRSGSCESALAGWSLLVASFACLARLSCLPFFRLVVYSLFSSLPLVGCLSSLCCTESTSSVVLGSAGISTSCVGVYSNRFPKVG